jgi:hypothetical protein
MFTRIIVVSRSIQFPTRPATESHSRSFQAHLCPRSDLGLGHLITADRLLFCRLLSEAQHVVQRLGEQYAPRWR